MASLIVPFMRPINVNFSTTKVKAFAYKLLGDYLEDSDYYIECDGQIVTNEDNFSNGKQYYVRLRVLGGKGGFGSMLRSIGAQIEKTTNREACRDLSGRRMRDINNEKKLQEWAAKAAEREKVKAERRRERRERMKAGAARHRFDDPQYEQQKASIAENLDDALEEGLMRAGPSCSSAAPAAASTASETLSRKRKCPATTVTDKKKARHWLPVDVDVSSSDDSSDDAAACVIMATTSTANQADDSGACCSHVASPPDAAGAAAAASESGGSGSEDNGMSVSTTSSSVTTEVDDDTQSGTTEMTTVDGSAATEEPVAVASISGENLDLDNYKTAQDLEEVGLEVLKVALTCRGLKCGGTLQQRAERLFSVKGLSQDNIPPSLFAKPPRK